MAWGAWKPSAPNGHIAYFTRCNYCWYQQYCNCTISTTSPCRINQTPPCIIVNRKQPNSKDYACIWCFIYHTPSIKTIHCYQSWCNSELKLKSRMQFWKSWTIWNWKFKNQILFQTKFKPLKAHKHLPNHFEVTNAYFDFLTFLWIPCRN